MKKWRPYATMEDSFSKWYVWRRKLSDGSWEYAARTRPEDIPDNWSGFTSNIETYCKLHGFELELKRA